MTVYCYVRGLVNEEGSPWSLGKKQIYLYSKREKVRNDTEGNLWSISGDLIAAGNTSLLIFSLQFEINIKTV